MDCFDVFLVLCSLACDTIHGEFSVIRQLMVIDVHLVYIYNVSNGLGLRCLGRQSMAQCSPGCSWQSRMQDSQGRGQQHSV